jgi:CheY-like chemotaxis protein
MPGIDGAETARIIRRERPEAVVVLVSAEVAGLESAGRSAGAVAVVAKHELCLDSLEALWSEHRRDA